MNTNSVSQPGPRLSPEEAGDLVARVGRISASSLPIAEGLRAAAEELPTRLSAALKDLAASLEAGQPLDAALAALKNRLPPHLRSLMLAGLASGQLGHVLQDYMRHQRHATSLRQAWMALTYPTLLVSLVLGVALFFAFTVAADVADLARDFGTELPAQTQVLLMISTLGWPVWLAIGSCLLLLLFIDWLVLSGRGRQTFISLLPIVGPLRRWLSMSNLSRLLALLVEQQVPLPEALRLSAEVASDPLVRRDVHRVSQRVAAGQSMPEAAQRTWLPPTFAALAGWGEPRHARAIAAGCRRTVRKPRTLRAEAACARGAGRRLHYRAAGRMLPGFLHIRPLAEGDRNTHLTTMFDDVYIPLFLAGLSGIALGLLLLAAASWRRQRLSLWLADAAGAMLEMVGWVLFLLGALFVCFFAASWLGFGLWLALVVVLVMAISRRRAGQSALLRLLAAASHATCRLGRRSRRLLRSRRE